MDRRILSFLVVAGLLGACAPRALTWRDPPSSILPDVPFFPDETDQCGPASLASVLNYWGKNVTPEELKEAVYVRGLRGTLPLDMLPALREYGLTGEIRSGSYEALREEIDHHRPVIAFLDFGTKQHPIGHFLVVTGYDAARSGLFVHSSGRKNKFATYRRFRRGWKDTDYWMLTAWPLPAQGSKQAAVKNFEMGPGPHHRAPHYVPALTPSEYFLLAQAYERQGLKEEATTAYKRALSRDKKFVPALIGLGNLAFEERDYRTAERHFAQALKIDRHNPAASNNLAMVYLSTEKNLKKAERLAQRAADSETLRPYALDTLAQIQTKLAAVPPTPEALP